MKRLLSSTVLSTLFIAASAQINMKNSQKVWMPHPKTTVHEESKNGNSNKPYGSQRSQGEKALGERVLGTTTYDLQTNRSVQDRITRNSSGEMSVVWTASEGNDPFSDRGSGYSYYNPVTDNWTLSIDYPRIETDRCGWPNILYDGNGGEILISHSTVTNSLRINTRSTIGSGSWSEKSISSSNLWWSRAAMGGGDGNTIHLIACTNPSADSTLFQNMSSALVYYRSQDAGQTWDIVDSILPGLDSSAMGTGLAITADAYAISAQGSYVAFAVFNSWNDVVLMESNNNGDTWTKTVVNDFPYRGYDDFQANYQSDTTFIITTDGSGSLIIDSSGTVHIAYARMSVSNDLSSNGYFRTYFTDSIVHYRHGANPYKGFSAYYADENGDTLLNFTKFAEYGTTGAVSHPNLAYSGDSIYLVWSGISDTISSGIDPAVNMRQIYLIRSGDGGETWSKPLQLTVTDPSFSENVYPDILPAVDDKIRLIFHRDAYPSGFVSAGLQAGTPGPNEYWQTNLSDNDVTYLEIDLSGNGIGMGLEKVLSPSLESSVSPNPSTGIFELRLTVYEDVNVRIDVMDLTGKIVHQYGGSDITRGSNLIRLDIGHLEKGLYLARITGGEYQLTQKLVLE